MKYSVVVALVVVAGPGFASGPRQGRSQPQQATVLRVQRREVHGPNICCSSAVDMPLQSRYYAYEISLRVRCGTYEGRYETAFDFFPPVFRTGNSLQVRLTKHDMYFDVPGGPDLKIPITHRSIEHGTSCDP